MRYRITASLLLLSMLVVFAGASEVDWAPWRLLLERAGFPENDEIRQARSLVIDAPSYPEGGASFTVHRQSSDGKNVRFEVRESEDRRSWYLIFKNQRGEAPNDIYPVWGRGTWIIKKDAAKREYLQAKIFLQDDENTFVRLYPAVGDRTRMNIFLYGKQIGENVMLNSPFEELVTSPFARVLYLSSNAVDWRLLFPDLEAQGYRVVESFVPEVTRFHDRIVEVEDAAIDGGGSNVFIDSGLPLDGGERDPGLCGLNCSGYVKWIADGLYSAWTGYPGALYMDIGPLKEPTTPRGRNPWSESTTAANPETRSELREKGLLRDPWFGLDWSRNLSRSVEQARLGRDLRPEEAEELDVTNVPWLRYRPERGYTLSELPALLYLTAAQRPGAVYFTSVNSRFVPPGRPDAEPMHQHWHVLALVSWFNRDGSFRAVALDTGIRREIVYPKGEGPTDLTSLVRRAMDYASLGIDESGEELVPEIYFHLSRADIPADFVSVPLPINGG